MSGRSAGGTEREAGVRGVRGEEINHKAHGRKIAVVRLTISHKLCAWACACVCARANL